MRKRAKVVLFLAVIILIAVYVRFEYSKRNVNAVTRLFNDSGLQRVDIGSYDGLQKVQQATIKEFSRQIKAHPTVGMFEVYARNTRALSEDESRVYFCYLRGDETLVQHFYSERWDWRPGDFPYLHRIPLLRQGNGLLLNNATQTRIHEAARTNMALAKMIMRWNHQYPK